MSDWLHDFRYALRMARKTPALSAVAIVTLALGLGANTAIFSAVNAVLLRPLPYRDPGRLALVWTDFQKASQTRAPASGPELLELRARSRSFEGFAGIWASSGTFTDDGQPEQVKSAFVTSNFFSLLGTGAQKGRTFLPQDEGPGRARVIVLGDSLWRERFSADASIVGKTVRFDGETRTVVGILPRDFRLIFPPDASIPPDIRAWIPFPDDLSRLPRDLNYIRVVGRMKPGVPATRAQEETTALARSLRSEFAEYGEPGLDLVVSPLHADAVRRMRPVLLALLAGVGLVLLITCVNVANLLLARARARRRELTLRAALGASRGRLLRQCLAESLVLAAFGGAAGLLTAKLSIQFFLAVRPPGLANLDAIPLDGTVVAYAAAISLLAGLLFGLLPALEHNRPDLVEALKEEPRIMGARGKTGLLLVAGEIAVGFVLLACAGLTTRTLVRLLNVDPGFQPEGVLTFQIPLAPAGYPKDADRTRFVEEFQRSIAALPGVRAAGAISHLPFDDYPNWYSYDWPEGTPPSEQTSRMADHRSVSAGAFASLGVPVLEGRAFDSSDRADSRRVVIVDDSLARETWPGVSAVGKKLNVEAEVGGDFIRTWAEVVGVVPHVRFADLTSRERGQVYLPYAQTPRSVMAFAVRVSGDPRSAIEPIRRELARLDRGLPLSRPALLTASVARARVACRFTTLLASGLAGIALLLSAVGIYGVLSYLVSQRIREIGVRMALGATKPRVVAMILREGIAVAALGTAAGAAAALGVTRLISGLLYGVKAFDPATYGVTALILGGAAIGACLLPAYRAARVDPMEALRYE